MPLRHCSTVTVLEEKRSKWSWYKHKLRYQGLMCNKIQKQKRKEDFSKGIGAKARTYCRC